MEEQLMSNITKNLILALTLVCIIALIVFCVQLIVLNRGVEPREPGAVVSGDSQADDEDTDQDADGDQQQNDIDDGNIDGTGGIDLVPEPPRMPPQGLRYEFLVTDSNRLVVYAQEELFDFEEGDLDWWFLYIGEGGGIATLEIAYTLITSQGVAAHAETFLNRYSGNTTSEFSGEQSIQGSELRGYHVSTQSGGEVYEAWIHTLDDNDLALVFVINYQNDIQRDALYEVLSTLSMISTSAAPGT